MSTVAETLDSIGKEFFVNYLDYFKDERKYPNSELIKIVMSSENYKEKSAKTRVYNSRGIIKNISRFREALQVLLKANISSNSKTRVKEELENLGKPEKKITRVTWNTNGWVYPSGRHGKKGLKDSNEEKYGFSCEEWLFDTSKVINEWCYGFLESIQKEYYIHCSNRYDVWLFSVDYNTKLRYWIGVIKNIEILEIETANHIKDIYRERGWLDMMKEQIIISGANSESIQDWTDIDIFNIRYKPENLYINDPYYVLHKEHPVYQLSWSEINRYKKEFENEQNKEQVFVFAPTSEDIVPQRNNIPEGIYYREPKTVEISYLHKIISEHLVEYLKKQYGKENVTPEHNTGKKATRIDIVVNDDDGKCIFYEIKTYNSLLASIREAIGQLMEYAFYPSVQNAKELIIITQKHSDISKVKEYMEHLRKLFNIPVYYQWFEWDAGVLSEKY